MTCTFDPEPTKPAPGRQSGPDESRADSVRTLAAVVSVAAVALCGAYAVYAVSNANPAMRVSASSGAGAPRDTRQARLASNELPFANVDSVVKCGDRGMLVAACIASEDALRPKAATLWTTAPSDTRDTCYGRALGAYEPVGKLYACLVRQTPVVDPS